MSSGLGIEPSSVRRMSTSKDAKGDPSSTEPSRKRIDKIIEGAAEYDDSSSDCSDTEATHAAPNAPPRVADGSQSTTISLKVPRHTQAIFADLANYLCTTRRVNPMIFIPGSNGHMGSISLFNNRSAFTCCWVSNRDGYRMTNLPDIGTVLVFHDSTSLGPQVDFSRPNHKYITLFTPDDKVHKISGPALLRPGNKDEPVVKLPVSAKYPASVSLDEFIATLEVIRESMCDSGKSSKTEGKAPDPLKRVSSDEAGVKDKVDHSGKVTTPNFGKTIKLGTSRESTALDVMDVEED
ncbi:hypothetical protein TSMEX_000001 [Taenia solium]|eukprot:TsM_000991600 transcript=TsM_000991600 gene=TsM_000991600